MRVDPIINDFSAGEISTQLYRRDSSEIYQRGLESTENVICLLHGGAFRRLGSERLSEAISASVRPRLIEFTTSTDSYVLELGANSGRLFDGDNSPVAFDSGVPPYSASEIREVQYAQDENMMVFFHENHPMQTLVESNGVFTWNEAMVNIAAKSISNPAAPVSGSIWTLSLTGSWSEGDTFILTAGYSSTGKIFYTTSTGVMAQRIYSALNVALRDTDAFILSGLTVNHTGTGFDYTIEFFDEYGDFVQNSLTIGSISGAGLGSATQNTTYPGSGIEAESIWSDTNGYPRAGTFWDQRLVVGGTRAEPATFWASRIGSEFDFITGPDSNDPVEFTLKSKRRCDIQTMLATERLTFGTSTGDFVLEGILSADVRFSVDRYTPYPAKALNAIELSGRVAYITADGKKVRILEYADEIKKWTAHDATFRAEGIAGAGITDICLAENPNQIAFCVREDGGFLAFAFDTDQGIAAWSKLHTPGNVGAICARRKGNVDEIWLAVQRGSSWQIERIPTSKAEYYSDINNASGYERQRLRSNDPCIDSYVAGQNVSTLTGLDHLNGSTVKVLGDGAYLGEHTVIGGQIEMTKTYGELIAGLGYRSTMRTLPVAGGNPLGSAQTMRRRWIKIFIALVDSVLPIVNGRREFTETEPQVMGAAPELLTGAYELTPSHTDKEGRVTVETDAPYPMLVSALYGEVQTGNS